MHDIEVQTTSWRRWTEFAHAWEQVHAACPGASFFLSREWVECWLGTFGPQLKPELAVFLSGGEIVALCLLVWRTQWVKGMPMRRVFLNCAGENETDSTFTEYNGLLSYPECRDNVMVALRELLQKRYWDELLLQGIPDESELKSMALALGSMELSERPCRYVDLQRLRRDDISFDAVLSPNTRQQILRSRRLYEAAKGPCILSKAASKDQALEMLDSLAKLHQISWQKRGRAGAFASPAFFDFHRKLVEKTFDRQKVLMMEVRAGDDVIGVLYSFVHSGRVYFYQSGFSYTSDGRLKPGLLTHYLAIRHCLEDSTCAEYDFLAGDSQYKRSLAPSTRMLVWVSVMRRTPVALTYRGLRATKRLCGQLAERLAGTNKKRVEVSA